MVSIFNGHGLRALLLAKLFKHGHEYMVENVTDQWYGPKHLFFKVRARDGKLYILQAPDLGA